MFKVFFQNSYKVWRNIGQGSKEDCSKIVQKFLNEHNYKSYYTNIIKVEDGVERWDVGSYNEFFWVINTDVAYAKSAAANKGL